MLIVYRLVCEKLTIFPYAECTMEFCPAVVSYDIVRFKIEVGVDAKFICKNVPRNEHDGHFDNDATRQPCFRLAAAHGRSLSMQLGRTL